MILKCKYPECIAKCVLQDGPGVYPTGSLSCGLGATCGVMSPELSLLKTIFIGARVG